MAYMILMTSISRNVVVNGEGELSFQYSSLTCRSHGVSITDFGGIGDGKTSNTKAFQAAMNYLTQFQYQGGSILYVPPGKWLTGSFNLTGSHFTLHLDKDASLLASQVLFLVFSHVFDKRKKYLYYYFLLIKTNDCGS